jgi:hypothetical protein
MSEAWDLMYAGNHDEAICLMRDNYAQRATMARTLGLGKAYLWLGDYSAAWEHFSDANRKRPGYCDGYYNMAGAAKWCVGDRHAAVQQWTEGCDCNYADGAGGVGAPLLLYAASILDPSSCDRSEAERLLVVRSRAPRIRNWPGPIAQYVLRIMDESALRQSCVEVNRSGTLVSLWLADFYVGLSQWAARGEGDLAQLMRKTAAIFPKDFTSGREALSLKLLHAEFFIARYEAARQTQAEGNL